MRHIPNILSFLRLAMVGLFIWLFLSERYILALIVYVAAFITDVLDGYLARRFNWITNLGKLLDPFADKLMLVSVLACLLAAGKIKWYLFAVMLLKEAMMIIGSLFLLNKRKVVVYSDWWGKIATGLFFASVSFSLIACADIPTLPEWVINVVFATALLVRLMSLFHYAYKSGLIGKKYKEHSAYENNVTDSAAK